jgi:hypothetical protein
MLRHSLHPEIEGSKVLRKVGISPSATVHGITTQTTSTLMLHAISFILSKHSF